MLTAIFAPWVVRNILAPGFTDPVKFKLTVDLVRIQLLAPVIFGMSGLAMGILNSHRSFLWPALAPMMYSIGKILGVVLLAPSMGVYGLAVGVVGGAMMHGLIQLPALLSLPERKYTFTLGVAPPDVREVARLMGPRLLGVAFVQLNFLVNTRLASLQPLGSVTAIAVGFALMMIPEAAIAQAIAIAALPTFSAQVAAGKTGRDALLTGSLATRASAPGGAGLVGVDPAARAPGDRHLPARRSSTPLPRNWWPGRCSGMPPGWWGIRLSRSYRGHFMPCTTPKRRSL